jgi:hypothetical protein
MECIGNETDESFLTFFDDFFASLLIAGTIEEIRLPFLEETFGALPKLGEELSLRRLVAKYGVFLHQAKGTFQNLLTMFRWLGVTNVEIQDTLRNYGFDSDTTFDDSNRTFDSYLQGKDVYILTLYGNITLTATLLSYIIGLIKWNEPINARLQKIIYFNIPATILDLPAYNGLVTDSYFAIEGGKLVQIFD